MSDNSKSELLKQLTIERSDEPPASLTVSHLLITGILSAALAGLLVFLLASPKRGNDASPVKVAPVPEAEAKISDPPATRVPASQSVLNASGYITARRVATVSSEVMGRIVAVEVEEGMEVKFNDVLARLDDSSARINLQLSSAQVVAQQERINSYITDLAEAERVLKRLRKLDQENFTSEAQLTRAQADVNKLSAGLASARAELKVSEYNQARLQKQLDFHTIRAPFAGVITVKNAQPGEIIAPAAAGGGFTRTGICTLVDMESLEVEVDVNEAFIGRVYSGQKVIANLDAYPDWDIPASVIAIIPTADRAKATVAVRIRLHVKDSRVLPNMGVKVAFYDQLHQS